MKCPHDSSRWELSGGELTGFGRDLGDGGVFGGLGGIMGWLAPVGGDLLSGRREKGNRHCNSLTYLQQLWDN